MDTFVTAVATAALSGAVVLLLQYFILPRLEREKTVQQESWKSKRDAFLDAIGTAWKVLASVPWEGGPADYRPSVDDLPDTNEINERLYRLYLLADDIRIPAIYHQLISGVSTQELRNQFLQLCRSELFGSKPHGQLADIPFYLPRSKEQLQKILAMSPKVMAIADKLEEAGGTVTEIQFHKPALNEVTLSVDAKDDATKNRCREVLRVASEVENLSLWCDFGGAGAPERFGRKRSVRGRGTAPSSRSQRHG